MNDLIVIFSYYSEALSKNQTKFITRDKQRMAHNCKRINSDHCYRYMYMCSNSVQHYGPDTYENAENTCLKSELNINPKPLIFVGYRQATERFFTPKKLHESSLLTPSVLDQEKNPGKSFWTGTKRFNSSHFISETGQLSNFSDELHDWQNFLPAVQLEGKLSLQSVIVNHFFIVPYLNAYILNFTSQAKRFVGSLQHTFRQPQWSGHRLLSMLYD